MINFPLKENASKEQICSKEALGYLNQILTPIGMDCFDVACTSTDN